MLCPKHTYESKCNPFPHCALLSTQIIHTLLTPVPLDHALSLFGILVSLFVSQLEERKLCFVLKKMTSLSSLVHGICCIRPFILCLRVCEARIGHFRSQQSFNTKPVARQESHYLTILQNPTFFQWHFCVCILSNTSIFRVLPFDNIYTQLQYC